MTDAGAPLRVLHTEASLGWGGQEIRILTEARGVARRGHAVTLAAPAESRIYQEASRYGVNAIALPPGYETGRHFHDEQEELYFCHRGTIEVEFGDGAKHVLKPGGVARVDPATVRKVKNVGSDDAIYIIVGAKDGYVGRDGRLPEGETSRFGSAGDPG